MSYQFSIIIPVYQTQMYQLDECLHSLLVQDTNLLKEIILVDDGNSAEYKKDLLDLVNTHTHTHTNKSKSSIKIINLPANKGLAHARKTGFYNSSGDIVIFIDSDDYILDCNFLNKIKDYFNNNQTIDLVSYDLVMFNEQNQKRDLKKKIKTAPNNVAIHKLSYNYFFSLSYRSFIPVHSFAFKRSVLEKNKILFNEINEYTEDVYFLAVLLSLNLSCLVTDETFYAYRLSENSITQKINKKSKKDIVEPIRIIYKWLTHFDDFNINNAPGALDIYIDTSINTFLLHGYYRLSKSVNILPNKQQIIGFCNKYNFTGVKKIKIKLLKLMLKSRFLDLFFSTTFRFYKNTKSFFKN